jgi:hypothetical protein
MISVAERLIRTNPTEAQAHCANREPLWNRMWVEEREDKLRADRTKFDTEQEKWKADMMKAYEEK